MFMNMIIKSYKTYLVHLEYLVKRFAQILGLHGALVPGKQRVQRELNVPGTHSPTNRALPGNIFN